MNYFLGVDAGGSKTKAVVVDDHSTILGEANGGPANYHNTGIIEATTNVMATVAQALEQANVAISGLARATIGIASCDTKKDYDRLFTAFSTGDMGDLSGKLTLVKDGVIALYSGVIPPGIVVICGTGSLVYGKNSHGDEAQAGNWGHFLGDDGSGYMLAKRMFKAIVAQYDGVGPITRLTEKLENKLQVKSPADIVDWYNETKPNIHVISDFVPLVIKTAEEGDEVAREMVDLTIAYLGKSVISVVNRLKMDGEVNRIVTSGGLFGSNYFRALFEGHITALLKRVRLIKPLVSPAVGAALMAKHEWEMASKESLL